jgi:beta-phosphoglucomutase-like phosphatase (HAD superfamily)
MSPATPVLATCAALLVDLDGTLLDTTLAVEASWRKRGGRNRG